MSQTNMGIKAFEAAEDLEAYRQVKRDANGKLVYADAVDEPLGTTAAKILSGSYGSVILRNVGGSRKVVTGSSCSRGARLFDADDGKVDDVATGGRGRYVALEASGGAGVVVEALEVAPGPLLAASVAASSAVTASATPTTFSTGSKTINGALLRAGHVLRLKAAGSLTSTGSETVTVELLVGTEVVATTGAVNPADSGDIFRLEADVIVRVAGASGKLLAHGTVALGTPGTVTAKPFCNAEASEDISSEALAITCRATNSSTGESVVLQAFTVELIEQ